MYAEYAKDPLMRRNVGIARRLFPLLENDRRVVELFHAMLLSMMGSPVLYYGDEIGMGDNIYLGDRDGVRTPMQWTPDRNGGFSRADFARLYLPPSMDPVYGFAARNVEAQLRDPSSFLHWIQRMLEVRREHPVLARRHLRGGRRREPVGARLRAPRHRQRRRRAGRHRRVRQQPQPVRAAGRAPARAVRRAPADRAHGPGAVPEDRRAAVLRDPAVARLLLVRPRAARGGRSDLARRRCCRQPISWPCCPTTWPDNGGTPARACPSASRSSTSRCCATTCPDSCGRWSVSTGDDASYQLFVGLRALSDTETFLEGKGRGFLGDLDSDRGPLLAYDALVDPDLAPVVLAVVAPDEEIGSMRPMAVEQTNTSVVFDDRIILKVFRRVHDDPNPDAEVVDALAAVGYEHTPQADRHVATRRRATSPSPASSSPAAPTAGTSPPPRCATSMTAGSRRRSAAATSPSRRRASAGPPPSCTSRWPRRSGRAGRPRRLGRRAGRRDRSRRPRASPTRSATGCAGEGPRSSRSGCTATCTSARSCAPTRAGSSSTSRASRGSPSPSGAARRRRCATSPACCARSTTPPGRRSASGTSHPTTSCRRSPRRGRTATPAPTCRPTSTSTSVEALLPADESSLRAVLAAHELAKAVYEVGYERAHRPDWEPIPAEAVDTARGAVVKTALDPQLQAIVDGTHTDPHAVLGRHGDRRAGLATRARCRCRSRGRTPSRLHDAGLFEAPAPPGDGPVHLRRRPSRRLDARPRSTTRTRFCADRRRARPPPHRRGPAPTPVGRARRPADRRTKASPAPRSRCGRPAPGRSGSSATGTAGTGAPTRCAPLGSSGVWELFVPARRPRRPLQVRGRRRRRHPPAQGRPDGAGDRGAAVDRVGRLRVAPRVARRRVDAPPRASATRRRRSG